jgi:hypothetical protein
VHSELSTPIRNITIGSHVIEAHEAAHIRVRINTAAGTVEIVDPVECLVIDGHEDEFIVGSDLLRSLGIDVDRQLEKLAERAEGSDDDDTYDSEDETLAANSTPSTDGVGEALARMVSEAVENGFPAEHADRLKSIVEKHDVWRLDRVPPLAIQLNAGAQPVKFKRHRYPPAMTRLL